MIDFDDLLVARTCDGVRVGNVWRVRAKKSDFYIEPVSEFDPFHVSIHLPQGDFPEPRFHAKVDPRKSRLAAERGYFLAHQVPRHGVVFSGREVRKGAHLLARIRWTWDIQRLRYRDRARGGGLPSIGARTSGVSMGEPVDPNEALDFDIVLSKDRPQWQGGWKSRQDNAQVGPLKLADEWFLTGECIRRGQHTHPAPHGLVAPAPQANESANRILACGTDEEAAVYWMVESMTDRSLLSTNLSRPTR